MNKKGFLSLTLSSVLLFSSQAYSAGIDDTRTAYLEILDQQIKTLNQMGATGQIENLKAAKNQLMQLTYEQLSVLPSGNKLAALKKSSSMMDRSTKKIATNKVLTSFSLKAATTLTQPDYADFPLCGTAPGVRYGDLDVFISEQALFVAEAIREVASRGCEQVAVVAGFGANTSAACIITDAIYIAAKEANNILSFCDAEVDEAQLETAFLRTEDLFNLGHEISDELQDHHNDMKLLINSHDDDMKAALSTHDGDIKSDIAFHDMDIKTALNLHDSDIKDLLNVVLGNQGQMLANQAEIIQLLKTPSGRRPGWNKP